MEVEEGPAGIRSRRDRLALDMLRDARRTCTTGEGDEGEDKEESERGPPTVGGILLAVESSESCHGRYAGAAPA